MTTKVKHGEGSQLVPALGESWGHASTVRVILYREGQQRYAWLYKSPSKKEATVPYQVTVGLVVYIEIPLYFYVMKKIFFICYFL